MTDAIDRLLKQDAAREIADEAFTARVMGALPPSRKSTASAWITPVLVLGSAALGSALAVAFSPAGMSLLQGFQDLVQMRGMTQPAIAGLAISVSLLVSAVILATSAD